MIITFFFNNRMFYVCNVCDGTLADYSIIIADFLCEPMSLAAFYLNLVPPISVVVGTYGLCYCANWKYNFN